MDVEKRLYPSFRNPLLISPDRPLPKEVAVIGVPHDDFGEEVAAIIVLQDGADMDPKVIQDYVKKRVAPYKYPRIIQINLEPLPKSGTGKILKKEIRKNLK